MKTKSRRGKRGPSVFTKIPLRELVAVLNLDSEVIVAKEYGLLVRANRHRGLKSDITSLVEKAIKTGEPIITAQQEKEENLEFSITEPAPVVDDLQDESSPDDGICGRPY